MPLRRSRRCIAGAALSRQWDTLHLRNRLVACQECYGLNGAHLNLTDPLKFDSVCAGVGR
jgi:hypothetical protein